MPDRLSGPGFRISDFESNNIIAQLQVDGAQTLMSQSLAPVTGAVKYVHTYMNMTYRQFQLPNGTTVQTCPPAMGYSFAGGTTYVAYSPTLQDVVLLLSTD